MNQCSLHEQMFRKFIYKIAIINDYNENTFELSQITDNLAALIVYQGRLQYPSQRMPCSKAIIKLSSITDLIEISDNLKHRVRILRCALMLFIPNSASVTVVPIGCEGSSCSTNDTHTTRGNPTSTVYATDSESTSRFLYHIRSLH